MHAGQRMRQKKQTILAVLTSLLALRKHYLELMNHQIKLAELFGDSASGAQAARDTYAELDTKLRDVSLEIEQYHADLVRKCKTGGGAR